MFFTKLLQKGKKGIYQYWAIQLLFIGGGYYSFLRFFVFSFLVGYSICWFDIIIYFVIVIGFISLFWIIPLYMMNKAKDVAAGIKFYDSMIQKGKKEPDNLALPVRQAYKIDIDFSDSKDIKKWISSRTYEIYLYAFTRQQIEKTYKEKNKTPSINTLKKLDEIDKKLQLIQEHPGDQKILTTTELEKEREELTDLVKLDGIDIIYRDYEELDFTKLRKEDLKELKNLELYYLLLDSEQHISFEEEGFLECFVLIPGSYSELLETHKEEGDYNDWTINISSVFCFWNYWFKPGKNIPVLYLGFSENMGKKTEDLLEKLTVEAFAFIQLQVMKVWVIQTETNQESLEWDAKYYQYKADLMEKNYSNIIQEDADIDLKYSRYFTNKALNIERAKSYKAEKKASIYRLGLLFASTISIILLILLVV